MKKNILYQYLQVYSLVLLVVSYFIFNLDSNMLIILLMLFSFVLFILSSFLTPDDRINIFIMFFLVAGALHLYDDQSVILSNVVPLYIFFMIFKLIMNSNLYALNNFKYFALIILFFLIAVLSAFNASEIFHQSYLDSIISNRNYLTLLACIPLFIWLLKGYEIEKILIIFTLISCSLFILQYILIDYVQFLSFVVQERFGARLRLGSPLIYLGALVSINYFIINISRKISFKWVGLFTYFSVLFVVLFVNQTRSIFVALLISGLIILILSNTELKNKFKVLVAIVLLLVITIPIYAPQLSDMVQSIMYDLKYSTGNLEVRDNATEYYVSLGENTPLIGHGFINMRTSNTSSLLPGIDEGLFWVDIGIYGLFFLHGIFGVIWYLSILLIILKNFKLILKHQKTYLIALVVYNIITITFLAEFYSFLFSSAFVIAVLNYIKFKERTVLN